MAGKFKKRVLSFVVPCYGSEKSIGKVLEEIVKTVRGLTKYDYEIILVDDNSPDNVFDVIKRESARNKRIKGIRLSRNFGQHAALMAGYAFASGDYIVSLDDDGQTPACDVMKLVEKVEEGADAVYAKYETQMQNVLRKTGSRINQFMMEIFTSKPKTVDVSSYFIMKKFVAEELLKYRSPYPYIGGLICRVTRSIENVNVKHRKRVAGRSGYNFEKLIGLWLNGFTAFSIKPLRIASFFGAVVAGFGFLTGIYIIARKLMNPDYLLMGWTSTISVMLFLGGIIMLMLGVIGEYVGRIYMSLNKSPQYVVKERINI